MALASTAVLGLANMPLKAQASTDETSSTNSRTMPALQNATGGHMSFEVASIHLAEPGARWRSNVALNVEDEFIPPGGRFSSTARLADYSDFA